MDDRWALTQRPRRPEQEREEWLGRLQVLLLDEPANGLDPDGIRWLRAYLRDFAERGGTVFVSSHLIGKRSTSVDDLVVICGGRLLEADSLAAIVAGDVVTVVVETPTGDRADRSAARTRHRRGGRRRPTRGARRAAVPGLAFDHHIQLTELTETSTSVEDRLLDLTVLRPSSPPLTAHDTTTDDHVIREEPHHAPHHRPYHARRSGRRPGRLAIAGAPCRLAAAHPGQRGHQGRAGPLDPGRCSA